MISTVLTALPSAAHPSASLPRGLREEASAMTTDAFHATYAPNGGPLRLGSWECIDADRPATWPGPRTFQATIAVGDRISTATATAGGPIGALTAMLHDHGIAVEMLTFHQRHVDGGTATYVHGTDGARDRWAMGLAEDGTQSALRAVIACANRLYAD